MAFKRSGVRLPYAPPFASKSEPAYVFVSGVFGCIFPITEDQW